LLWLDEMIQYTTKIALGLLAWSFLMYHYAREAKSISVVAENPICACGICDVGIHKADTKKKRPGTRLGFYFCLLFLCSCFHASLIGPLKCCRGCGARTTRQRQRTGNCRLRHLLEIHSCRSHHARCLAHLLEIEVAVRSRRLRCRGRRNCRSDGLDGPVG
jgi:hypothetical protein